MEEEESNPDEVTVIWVVSSTEWFGIRKAMICNEARWTDFDNWLGWFPSCTQPKDLELGITMVAKIISLDKWGVDKSAL